MTATIKSKEVIRTVIWQGQREALIMDENVDGSVALIKSTEVDDGPSRSLLLQPGSIGALADRLSVKAFGSPLVEAAVGLLAVLEWGDEDNPGCPFCGMGKETGHLERCQLSDVLVAHRETVQ